MAAKYNMAVIAFTKD